MKLAIAAALLSATIPTATSAAAPWAEIARADIDAIRQLLKDNHPGPVDPENRLYAERFESNYPTALAQAAAARTFFDYKRALLSYTNGFRDGHTVVLFMVDTTAYRWPGFAVTTDERGSYRVAETDGDLPFKAGDEIMSCDGSAIDQLMRERIDPFHWNADIPHERQSHIGKLFVVDAGDEASKMKSCTIRTADGERDVPLNWRSLPIDRANKRRGKHVYEGEPKLTKADDAWVIELPSFTVETPVQEAQFKRVLSQIQAHSSEIQSGKVVLDVRGNAGGSSAWASEIASAIWGEPLVKRTEESFDWTVDWRASPANLKRLDETVARYERNNLLDSAASVRTTRNLVATALREGRSLARVPNRPEAAKGPPPESPFTGHAYLLTDGVCASACLDFADIVRRMPNAIQIGWPTSADAVYIDNTLAPLPSGLGMFAYSMKVYRNRVRANNQWYDPQIPWPGGAATDAAVTDWISGLK